jgi:hypothetical protein
MMQISPLNRRGLATVTKANGFVLSSQHRDDE